MDRMVAVLALFCSPALAGGIEVRAAVDTARAVIAVVRDGATSSPAACNDAGVAPDAAADGIWSCPAVEISGDRADVVLIVDGRATDAGLLQWEGYGARVAAVSLASGMVTASIDPGTLAPRPGASPSPGAPLTLARVVGYGAGAPPVLVIGRTQLFCHDDGNFPDFAVNDGQPGCAGVVPGDGGAVSLRGQADQAISAGTVTWGAEPIRFLTVDYASLSSSSAPFDLPLPPLPPSVLGEAASGATAVQPTSIPDEAATAAPLPAPSPEPQPQDNGGVKVHATGVGETLLGPWPWIVFLVGGGGGIVALRRLAARPYAVRATLKPLQAPPLFPGGPPWSEAALVRAADPTAFVLDVLPTLAQAHRVVLVLPGLVEVPPVGGAGAWIAMVPSWEEVAAGVVELARSEGAPVALLVLGGSTVQDPGAVNPDALGKLMRALPPGIWMGVVAGPDEAVAAWLPVWKVSGPPWSGARA